MSKDLWINDSNALFRETEKEFIAVSCLTFITADRDKHIYSPSIHKIDKSKFHLEDINEIAEHMFNDKAKDMSLAQKVVYLSAFIGTCEDAPDADNNGLQVTFENGREATKSELKDILYSVAEKLNL